MYLALVEDFLRNLILEDLWRTGLLEDLVLAQREETFEDVLCDGEAYNELLPWEEGPVEEARETLFSCISLCFWNAVTRGFVYLQDIHFGEVKLYVNSV